MSSRGGSAGGSTPLRRIGGVVCGGLVLRCGGVGGLLYGGIFVYVYIIINLLIKYNMSGLGLGVFNSLFGSKPVAAAPASGASATGSVKVGGGGPGSGTSSRKRCTRGSRRNKKTGECVRVAGYTAKKRCPNGTRRSKVSGSCVSKSHTHTSTSSAMKSSVKKVKQVAKEALVEVAELKKADTALAAATVKCGAAARAAAALKRQKKTASNKARLDGKIAAAVARAKEADRVETVAEKERADLFAKIARTRKAMGIRKNEDNPAELRRLIEQWEMEARMRIHNRGGDNKGPKQVEPSRGA